ncbi:MAG TPA: hypothetical protein VK699_17515 [Terriglobales bacterium]|jgi:hypothetical protein|nr:hypothetical protein [Terriglobales bacterium]
MTKTTLVLLASLFLLTICAFAQNNEFEIGAGGIFTPNLTAQVMEPGIATGVTCPINNPVCAQIPTRFHLGSRLAFEGAYGRRIIDAHAASLYVELPVLGIPGRGPHPVSPLPNLPSGIAIFFSPLLPDDFSSVFITPSVKVKFLPGAAIAPFISAGGGVALFNSVTTDAHGIAISHRNTTTGAFQVGGGVDIKTPIPRLGVRAEVREFLTGRPEFEPAVRFPDHLQNLFVGGGIVLRF